MLTLQQIYFAPPQKTQLPFDTTKVMSSSSNGSNNDNTTTNVSDTSSYKYAVISSDPAFNKTYKSKTKYADDFMTFRSSLPVYNCCYAVYNVTFVHQMKRKSAVVFYTWLPADAPAEEKDWYLANSSNVAKMLSHYDYHFVCTKWREFQQSVVVPKISKLLGEVV